MRCMRAIRILGFANALMLLLSSKGYPIAKLQDIFEVDRDTISIWLDRFERQGIVGLEDMPRSGRTPTLYG